MRLHLQRRSQGIPSALGTHRHMTHDEMEDKLGVDVVALYPVHNHDWVDPDSCRFLGKTEQGVDVWINNDQRIQQSVTFEDR